MLKFELKKTLKQKKYIWALIIIVLVVSVLFSLNSYQRSRLQGNWVRYNSLTELDSFETEWFMNESELIFKRDQEGLNPQEEKQLEYSREIALALQRLRSCRILGLWDEVPRYYQWFYDSVEGFIEHGGEFTAIEGMEKELAIEKNFWLIEHNLPYEIEDYPLVQHLFLKDISALLFGIFGIAILLILFGNTITEEKENHTWQTLKTQPLSKPKLILSKYISFMLLTFTYILLVIAVGLIIPGIINGWNLNLQYPHVITQGDTYTIISTGEYLLRSIILFLGASSITFSLSLILNRWVSKSLALYFIVGAVLGLGYFATSQIKTALNPLYHLNFKAILDKIPQSNDWIYILSAIIWSAILLIITMKMIKLPEREIKSDLLKISKPFAAGRTKTRGELIDICFFEWRKTKREALGRTLLIIILVMAVAGHFLLSQATERRREDYFTELEWRATRLEEQLAEAKGRTLGEEELNELEIDYEEYMLFREEYIKRAEKEIDMTRGVKEAYEQGDWKTFHEYQLYVIEKALEESMSPTGRFLNLYNDTHIYNEEVSYTEKQWLIEKDIQPVFSGDYLATIHQNWRGFGSSSGERTRVGWRGEELGREEWERQNEKIDDSGLFTLYLSFSKYIYLIPLLLILLFIGGGLAKEKGKKSTYSFLKTQPITENKIYFGKVINGFLLVVTLTLVISLLVVIVGTVFNRFGDWEYPILHYNSWQVTTSPDYTGLKAGFGYGYHFINIGEYLAKGIMLFMAMNLFFMAIAISLSQFFKRSLSVFAITVIIGVSGYYLYMKNHLQMSPWSPFSYFDIPKVLNGEIATRLNEPLFNPYTGAIVFVSFAGLITLGGYLLINRKKLTKIFTRNLKISKGNLKG